MNKRGIVGRALTILASSGIIALMFFLFIFVIDIGGPDKIREVRADISELSTAGQLRVIIARESGTLAQGSPGNTAELVKDAFGENAKLGLFIDKELVAGEDISKPGAVIDVLLPTIDGGQRAVVLEVAR